MSSSPSPPPDASAAGTDAPFVFPSISLEPLLAGESYTYHSPIPQALLDDPTAPVILGVDEAGRGPVLGPMVYASAYCHASYSDEIKRLGFADSKKMTATTRHNLLTSLSTPDHPNETYKHMGWSTTVLSPLTISTGMQRPPHHGSYNLNTLAHDTTIALIRHTLTAGVNLKEIYIDTVGPPHTYQQKLSLLFPTLKIVVEKQADGIYPIVSAASVCAKVTRDEALDMMIGEPGEVLGSGYPGDAKTIAYLKRNTDPVFGWRGEVVRFSWATARDLLEKDPATVKVEWAEPMEEGEQHITSFLAGGDGKGDSGIAGWYGKSVNPEMDF
ncbi:ribonuclease HII-domain-containing protein [Peziza echinospora]|nr:ribonuclease HII-domain-containing protein [Peziza echinospora]